MGLELVTGYSGKPHVTSYQQAMVHAGITGMDNAVFGYVGQALKAVVTSANNVRIYDGAGMISGKIFCVNKGEYVDVPIANGTSGKYRADIICVKYTKDTSTGVEEVEFQVVQGTEGTSYVDPAAVKNDLYSQGTIASQEKFYRVKLNGLAVEAVEPLFEKVVTNAELNSKIKSTGTIETLAWFHTTVFSGQGGIDLSKYSYLVLNCCAGSNSTPRALASTIISIDTLKYGDSGSMHEAAYAGDPSNYCASVYFSGSKTNATVNGKVKNATYCQAFLYGVLK